jgi:protein-tyrosine phosphatase
MVALAAQKAQTLADWFRGTPPDTGNYTLLEPGLFLGGRCLKPPPGTQVVLNVSPTPDEFPSEIMEWQPLHPGAPVTVSWLGRQIDFLATHHRAGRTLFVHCDAGIDRSATVVIAYWMWRDHLSRDTTLDLVQRKRPRVHPNQAYIQLLAQWETALQKPQPS